MKHEIVSGRSMIRGLRRVVIAVLLVEMAFSSISYGQSSSSLRAAADTLSRTAD